MANVNLVESNDISITQNDDDITLNVKKDSAVSTSSTKAVENQAITNYVDAQVQDAKDYTDEKVQEVYSTNETRIGTWIDGKPLYRKVISDTLGTTNGQWKEITGVWGANEIDKVVSFNGMFSYSNGNNYSVPFSRITSDSYASREYVLFNVMPSSGNVSVVAYHPSSYNLMSGRPFYAIILYTKTND